MMKMLNKDTFLSTTKPRITVNDIPEEVWWLIAEQTALMTDVVPLMGVNRSFFHYALACKYREVQWFVLSNSFLKKLERLQEPLVAQHVRVLHIRAWFIEYLLKRDALFRRPSFLSKFKKALLAPFVMTWSRIYGNSRHKMKPQWVLQHRHRESTQDTSCTRVISLMVRAVEGMHNVVQFNFEWRDLPLNPDTRRFLTSIRTSLDKSLRKLILRAQSSHFKELLAIANYDNLDELDFHFDYQVKDTSKAKSGKQIMAREEDKLDPEIQESLNAVIPFIERRQSSLRSLFISSTSSMDLSPFLNALPSNIPSLRRFGLEIFYDESTLSDPKAFLHILISRSFSLRHVVLSANLEQPTLMVDKRLSSFLPVESHLALRRSQWYRVNQLLLSHPRCLSNLETLDIPFVSLNKTLPLLQRSCDTLTRLRLVDHYLNRDEVTTILGLFSHRPLEVQHLHIEVVDVDFALIELLATRLPDLSSLVLNYRDAIPFASMDVNIFQVVPCLFNWKLQECEAYRTRQNLRYLGSSTMTSEESSLMNTLFQLIPSLKTCNRIPRSKY